MSWLRLTGKSIQSSHKIYIIKGGQPQRGFKIGLAVPCHISDTEYLHYSLASIQRLNPQPYATIVDINENSNLKDVRTLLFEILINMGCDVIFQVSADFYLLPDILKYVQRKRVCSFNNFSKRRYTLIMWTIKFVFRNGWTGCYSLPKEYWSLFKGKFDGTDSSIWKMIGRFNYQYMITPKWKALRPYQPSSVRKLLATKPLWKRIIWQWIRLMPISI